MKKDIKIYHQNKFKFINSFSLWLLLGLVFFPFSHIHAYLDPGSGSYAIQIIIGVIFGAGFTIKAFGRNIINYLRLKFSNRKRGR